MKLKKNTYFNWKIKTFGIKFTVAFKIWEHNYWNSLFQRPSQEPTLSAFLTDGSLEFWHTIFGVDWHHSGLAFQFLSNSFSLPHTQSVCVSFISIKLEKTNWGWRRGKNWQGIHSWPAFVTYSLTDKETSKYDQNL